MMMFIRRALAILGRSHRRAAARLFGLIIVGTGLETLGIGLVVPVAALLVQDVSVTRPELRPWLDAIGNPTSTQLLVGGMLVLVGVYLVKTAFLAFVAWLQAKFAAGIQSDLAQRLFATYLRCPYTFHLQHNSAQLIANVNGSVADFTWMVLNVCTLCAEVLVLVGIAGLLLFIEPTGAMVVVLILGGAAAIFHFFTRRRVGRWATARHRHEVQRLMWLQQGLDGAKDVKLLGREGDFLEQYGHHQRESARMHQHQRILEQLPRLWLEMLAAVGLATVVLTALARGYAAASLVPTLGLVAVAAFRAMPCTNRALTAVQWVRHTRHAVDLLHADLQLEVAPQPGRSVAPAAFERDIELVDVRFVYPGAHAAALTGVRGRIAKGESVGFVGASGAGKSTLVDVILGLLVPTEGRVLVDGRDIHQDLRGWQDQIGYVPQSIYLIDDTLRRNVAFGVPQEQIDDRAVQRAVRAAQLEEFVATLPKGLDTVVGEDGVRLSGGQRQRVGIARALYHDPPVIVLDEATSALDTTTEQSVMQAVAALHGRKTILIVAHRLSTVAECDRLYRLDRGMLEGEVVQSQSRASTP